jgi:division protein CdvB (Snf7/Vps24/ESCRT-III family)
MLNATSLHLPVQHQRRTLAQLDTLIARAEKDLARHAAAGRRLTGAGKDIASARTRLRLAEARLAMLRQSREYLLTGELPEAEARP